jgi:hypothetical protein
VFFFGGNFSHLGEIKNLGSFCFRFPVFTKQIAKNQEISVSKEEIAAFNRTFNFGVFHHCPTVWTIF